MIRKGLFLAVCLLFPLVTAYAQSNFAVVRGSVLDPQHRPIAGARVHLTSEETGAQRDVVADAAGIYEIAGLQPGSYEMAVESNGFQQFRENLDLEVGQQATVDVNLRVGAEVQNVKVEAAAGELLKTQDASVGEVVDQRSVDSLPLNGRMLIDLVLTVPGAHTSHGAATGDMNPLYWRPGQRSAVSIGGSRPNGNYFLLDGATNTDPTFSTQNLSASPDAVQEFQVQTGSYSTDMGGAGGGQVNIVTRAGTGAFHGTAYEFLRNGAMDATSFNQMGNNFLVQNNFGASVGGPIWRAKKTFFFVNYEALRHVQTDVMVDTVPTAQEMGGDFSQSGVDIYDPTTTQLNPNFNSGLPVSKTNPQYIRQQFQYNGVLNVIPPDRITHAASIMLNKYTPQPNTMDMGSMTMMGQPTVIGAGNDANNYLDARKERMLNDQGTFRVDHNFAGGDTAFFRYSASGEHGFHPQMGLPGFGFYHDDLGQHGVLEWIHVFNSHMVNEASGAISRLTMMHSTESAYKNDIVTQLGITGTGFGGPAAWGAPYFNVQGYSPLGDSYLATPMHAWDTVIEGRDSLSWQIGRHSTKFGGAYQWFIWPMWGFFQNRGYYQFTNGYTTEYAVNDGKTGSALASFELGLPAARQGQAGVPQMDLRQWYANGYAQDAWRLTSNLTLTYGLRYEFMSPLVDIRYTNSNLDLSSGTPQVFIGGQNGYPRGLMYSQKTNFAPRLGLAKSFPRLRLVAHVAYGVFYTPVDMNTWCNQRHNVPYVFPLTSQSDPFNLPGSAPTLPGTPITFNFPAPVLGTSVVSFTALQLHAPAQYIQQWSTSVEKQLGRETTLEVGYLGAGGFHLQRSHLINNAQPGPGLIQPRRPFSKNGGIVSFAPNTTYPSTVTTSKTFDGHFPVSTVNLLENSSQSWYDAGYVNVRRHYASGLSFLANYTFAKSLENAPDFRSPMFEAATPQNNDDLNAEKGPGCDVRHRFALSTVYSPKAWSLNEVTRSLTRDWRGSAVYQVQTGFPLTISVFGDTANAGTVVGENPIRANTTGQSIFGSGTRSAAIWFNPKAFATPPAYTYGNVGRNSVYGPGLQTMDLGITREFGLAEKARFEMRGEFFNTFNHTNLGTPNRFVNTANFGSITEIATPGREIQVSARLSF